MEEKNTTVKEKNGNVFVGVILSMLGGIIATIPWILVYVYSIVYWPLAIIIVAGAFYGYKLSKAKIGKSVPIVVGLTSIISVTLATLVVIPLLLIVKEGQSMSLENFKLLYGFNEFKSAIIRDYIVSLAFIVLSIGVIIVNIIRKIKNEVVSKDVAAIDNKDSDVTEKNSKKKNVIIAVISIIVLIVLLVVFGIVAPEKNDASFISSNRINIEQSNIKLNVPKDLKILSEDDINLIYGEENIDAYKLIAFSEDLAKAVYCFEIDINNEQISEEAKNPEGYLKLIFQDVLDKVVISKKTMAKKHWFVAEYEEENEGVMYKEDVAICEENGKLLCVNLIYPKDDGMQLEKIIRK